jgi:hypothetical protein
MQSYTSLHINISFEGDFTKKNRSRQEYTAKQEIYVSPISTGAFPADQVNDNNRNLFTNGSFSSVISGIDRSSCPSVISGP